MLASLLVQILIFRTRVVRIDRTHLQVVKVDQMLPASVRLQRDCLPLLVSRSAQRSSLLQALMAAQIRQLLLKAWPGQMQNLLRVMYSGQKLSLVPFQWVRQTLASRRPATMAGQTHPRYFRHLQMMRFDQIRPPGLVAGPELAC